MLSNAREIRHMSALISISSIADLTMSGDTEDVTGKKEKKNFPSLPVHASLDFLGIFFIFGGRVE